MKLASRSLLMAAIAGSAAGVASADVSVFPTAIHAAHNFIPFGVGTAAVPTNASTMHQVFASTLFSVPSGGQPVTITDIGFAAGAIGSYTSDVVVRLGYTTRTPGVASPAGLSIPTAGGGGTPNATGAMTTFYSNPTYMVTTTAASTTNFNEVHFGGAFVYDPALGHLLVEIVNTATLGTLDLTVSRSAGTAESSRAYTTTRFPAAESPTTASRMQFTYTIGGGPTGACCITATGACITSTATGCTASGGVYQGDGSQCGSIVCPQPPTGACCFFASCSVVTQAACTSGGGAYQGNGSACGSCPAVPPVIYSNCGISTGPNTLSGAPAPAGSTWSECARDETQTTLTNTVAGFGLSGALRLADDFVVPAGGMNLAYVKVLAYTTNATTPTGTGATLRILDGSPLGTPNVVFGDQTTNRMAFCGFTNMYRIFPTTVGIGAGAPCVNGAPTAPGTTRRLQEIYITVNQFLPAGTYWLDFNTAGTTFAPPATQTDAIGRQCNPNNSNGLQFNAAWVALNDGGHGCDNGVAVTATAPVNVQQDTYFELLGTAGAATCYANCDASTLTPCLNVNDFLCFNNLYAAGSSSANCDQSTLPPVLNVNDFLCFNNRYAAGCTNPCAAP